MIEIRHRYTQAVLFRAEEATTVKEALRAANLAGANLADANLAGANLARADLAGANLARANLADAYLADAKNVAAGVERKDPPEPYKRATTTVEVLARRRERAKAYRERHPDVPVVENLDARILDAIAGGGVLDMSQWHGDGGDGGACGTTHCRAGWAIHLAGAAGAELERRVDSEAAGRMIYLASTGRAPYFFGSNERALEDVTRCAAEAAESASAEPVS